MNITDFATRVIEHTKLPLKIRPLTEKTVVLQGIAVQLVEFIGYVRSAHGNGIHDPVLPRHRYVWEYDSEQHLRARMLVGDIRTQTLRIQQVID